MFGGNLLGGLRRATHEKRGVGFLYTREQNVSICDLQVLAVEAEFLASDQGSPDAQELVHKRIAGVMFQEYPIACELDWIAAAHHIHDQSSGRHPVEGCCHACRGARRHQARSHRDDKLQSGG